MEIFIHILILIKDIYISFSKSVATKHRNMTTNMTHSDPTFYGGLGLTLAGSAEEGASHVSIVDAQELMVSVTS